MKPYPADLTTSDWIDWLLSPGISRADQIAGLATFHRRIEKAAKVAAIDSVRTFASPDEKLAKPVHDALNAAVSAVPDLGDYKEA